MASSSWSPGAEAGTAPSSAMPASKAARMSSCAVASLPASASAHAVDLLRRPARRRGDRQRLLRRRGDRPRPRRRARRCGDARRAGASGASDIGIPYDYAGQPTLEREQNFATTSCRAALRLDRRRRHLDNFLNFSISCISSRFPATEINFCDCNSEIIFETCSFVVQARFAIS